MAATGNIERKGCDEGCPCPTSRVPFYATPAAITAKNAPEN